MSSKESIRWETEHRYHVAALLPAHTLGEELKQLFSCLEELGLDEMRISFMGSSPVPPTRTQAATCIMVELDNGKRFFFDLGPRYLRNIVAMQVPLAMLNDIFLTHLHIDHYGELPYIYCFPRG